MDSRRVMGQQEDEGVELCVGFYNSISAGCPLQKLVPAVGHIAGEEDMVGVGF